MENMSFEHHIARQFDEDLESVRSQLLEMGGKVEAQLANAMKAIEEADSAVAEEVLLEEEKVDVMEVEIDEACATIIARRQPAASDLRLVLAIGRIVRDLERIGDEASKIAKMSIALSEQARPKKGFVEIRHLASGVSNMLNSALDAFARYDYKEALRVRKLDNQIDVEYKTAMRELITYMMEDPRSIGRVMNILWVVRSLERIGDHSKNICEHIVYLVKGKDIRHGQLDRLEE